MEELTVKEFYEMQNSDFLTFKQEESYWLDLSKFAFLLNGVMQVLGGEGKEITELIGESPEYGEKATIKELSESDLHWIEWAKENNYNYKITKTGVKISK